MTWPVAPGSQVRVRVATRRAGHCPDGRNVLIFALLVTASLDRGGPAHRCHAVRMLPRLRVPAAAAARLWPRRIGKAGLSPTICTCRSPTPFRFRAGDAGPADPLGEAHDPCSSRPVSAAAIALVIARAVNILGYRRTHNPPRRPTCHRSQRARWSAPRSARSGPCCGTSRHRGLAPGAAAGRDRRRPRRPRWQRPGLPAGRRSPGDPDRARRSAAEIAFTFADHAAGLPVRSYTSTLTARPVTLSSQTYVEWSSRFDCDEADEDKVIAAIRDGVLVPGLKALEQRFGPAQSAP